MLEPSVPPAALEGLAGFSHCWVLFKFHINVESGKQRKANEGTRYAAKVGGARSLSRRSPRLRLRRTRICESCELFVFFF